MVPLNFNREEHGLIEVKDLCKSYGAIPAVRDISFKVEKGKVYGFLGPNGAGKSTTMNMITGCLAPTSGEVLVDGLDICEDAVEAKRRIGYLPELPPLYTDMTPLEYLEFVGRAKGIAKAELYDSIEAVMKKTGIADVANRLIRNLSKGYRQRVGIAQAILGDPEYIILDEPTVGLDPLQIIEVRELIVSLKEEHAVILSSHILQEIDAVCDYVIMISRGKVVADGDISELVGENESLESVFIRLAGESLDAGAAYAAQRELEREAKGKNRKKIKVASEKGAAYYTEVYADEDENETPVPADSEKTESTLGLDADASSADGTVENAADGGTVENAADGEISAEAENTAPEENTSDAGSDNGDGKDGDR